MFNQYYFITVIVLVGLIILGDIPDCENSYNCTQSFLLYIIKNIYATFKFLFMLQILRMIFDIWENCFIVRNFPERFIH